MRASILIAAHDEGESLSKTIRSVVESSLRLEYEIVVADDGSTDRSVEAARKRYPQIRVVRHEKRLGVSPAKHLAASAAHGDVLVFLDGHSNPEPGAIQRLVEDVEMTEGKAVITPKVPALCPKTWINKLAQAGHGYRLGLEKFDHGWLPLARMKAVRHGGRQFYESPALIGCALATSAALYHELHGFDAHMLSWGVEDLDFGLRTWLFGHSILHDPEAAVGHRFQQRFESFEVPLAQLTANQLRMARKNFTHGVWGQWLEKCRERSPQQLSDHPEGFWARTWELFLQHEASAESERAYVHARRSRDEFWYAQRFGLKWPKIGPRGPKPIMHPGELLLEFASPSPDPCGCKIKLGNKDISGETHSILVGQHLKLTLDCKDGTPERIKWSAPGIIFKDYDPGHRHATLEKIQDADTQKVDFEFYWSDPGNGRVVEVDFNLNGRKCGVQTTFNVLAPSVIFPNDPPPDSKPNDPPQIGVVCKSANDDRVGLYQPSGVPPGIKFLADVQPLPAPFDKEKGRWNYVQLVETDRITRSASDPNACNATRNVKKENAHIVELGPVVDAAFDRTDWIYAGTWNTGSFAHETIDFPSHPIRKRRPPNIQLKFHDKFTMYIMFLPPGADSRWVPLRKVDWEFSWCCTYHAATQEWTIDQGDPPPFKPGKWQTAKQLPPIWNENVHYLDPISVECPAPCK
jgi:GT2 family glycosyltransferase